MGPEHPGSASMVAPTGSADGLDVGVRNGEASRVTPRFWSSALEGWSFCRLGQVCYGAEGPESMGLV